LLSLSKFFLFTGIDLAVEAVLRMEHAGETSRSTVYGLPCKNFLGDDCLKTSESNLGFIITLLLLTLL
jgi:hypothetical protein